MTIALPACINPEAWAAFVEMRKKIKKPLTGYAETLALKKLLELKAAGQDPNAVLDQSTLNCWAGLFAIRVDLRNSAISAAPPSQRERRAADRYSEMSGGLLRPIGTFTDADLGRRGYVPIKGNH